MSGLGLPQPPEWMAEGLCAQTDPDAFYPEKGGSVRAAKSICNGDPYRDRQPCPVREACLAYALDNEERFGIWGGRGEKERRRMRPARPLGRPPVAEPRRRAAVAIDHGTEPGYRAHGRLGEDPCDSCDTAMDTAVQAAVEPAPQPVPVATERPGVTRPWRPAELAEAVRLLTDYGMGPAEIAAELHVTAARVRRALPARRGAA